MDFLSPILTLMGSTLLTEFARANGISDKLKMWGRMLRRIQVVIDSAEEKHMNGDPAAGQWLSDLREVVYDMEDLLDVFSVEAKGNASKKRTHALIDCCSRLDPRNLISDHHMANEIEDVEQRLEEVFRHLQFLGLVQKPWSQSPSPTNFGQPFFTTSLPEPKFVSREKQMEELLARLTGFEATDDSVQPFTVVSIVGMGGLGKTTLAQELYSHESLNREAFEVKAWACVSDIFDSAAITKSILDQVAPHSSDREKDLNLLQNSLKEKLSGKKFLIVLDDVWNNKYEELLSLLKPLYFGGKGSRILLTTRNLDVAKLVGDRNPRRLDMLLLEDCLSLLAYHSIGEENFQCHPHLQDVAVELAEKCKGLPLSIKTIAGMLRFESDEEKWKRVLAHGIWDREDGHGKIPPALKLSYVHLPSHLKRCFAACALFPKDYSFDQDELIQLWIIQGLLHKGGAKTYREVGLKNIHCLETVSLIHKARNEKTQYLMHDLINDLAKSITLNTFSSDEYKEASSHNESLDKVRHAAMVVQRYEKCLLRKFDVYRSMKKLRTFMPFQISADLKPNVCVSHKVIHDLVMDMKNLRMLSLRYFLVSEVSDQIGELKLLRSIDFSYTEIEQLPDSVCNLVELQYLLLRGCTRLKKLPINIHKLTNLLHLDITDTNSLEEMPPHIGNMTNLEILSSFVVGKEAGRELKQLGPLKCLQRELHVRNLLNVDDAEDAMIAANLREKEGIHELSFDWGSSFGTPCEDDHQLRVLDHLKPPRKILSLAIYHYGGKNFPSWFHNPHHDMDNVVSITLAECRSVDSLPPFGLLPSLERLEISGLVAVSSIGAEFYGTKRPFQALRSLKFENMETWKKWSSNEDYENDLTFPCLNELKVKNCPKLKGGFTLCLPYLVDIDIDGCNEGLLKCLVKLTSITKMNICNIPRLVNFDARFSTSWVALEEMRIEGCPRFKSFTYGDGGKQVPPRLKILEIIDCEDLEELPDDLSGLTSLNEIYVDNCGNLSSFPNMGLPPALRKVEFRSCPSLLLSQLITSGLLESLEVLILKDLEGFTSIPDLTVSTQLSRSLRVLVIRGCERVTTLPDSLQHLSTLSELTLWDCGALEVDYFPALPCNLSSFKLSGCPKVKHLPHDMHNLTSLKTLYVSYCDSITRLPSGGLPLNLEWLSIRNCPKLNQPIETWGLHSLPTLRILFIRGKMECVDEMECFPPCHVADSGAWLHMLPSSLIYLSVSNMNKLKRIACTISTHLTSLQALWIYDCPRMKWLPDDGLPEKLEKLDISGCPLLKERCSKPNGEYWPLIQLIPDISIS